MADRLNKLNGKEWLQHSFSIWRDIQKNQEERALKHPAMFPIMLAERIIEIFTNKPGMTILDPFMGSGTTLIAAQKLGHNGIGFDISNDYVKMAKERLQVTYKELFNKNVDHKIYCDTAYKISKYCEPDSVDLCITSPPYWDILNQKRTADRKQIRKYSDLHVDFSNIENYENFLNALKKSFTEVYKVLKINKFCVVIVMDIRKKSHFYSFHFDLAQKIKEINFSLQDIIIWDRQKEYNNMRPLGYPYSFIVNKVHEYIMIFKKI